MRIELHRYDSIGDMNTTLELHEHLCHVPELRVQVHVVKNRDQWDGWDHWPQGRGQEHVVKNGWTEIRFQCTYNIAFRSTAHSRIYHYYTQSLRIGNTTFVWLPRKIWNFTIQDAMCRNRRARDVQSWMSSNVFHRNCASALLKTRQEVAENCCVQEAWHCSVRHHES